jgi:hypothetical protein
MGAPKSLRTPAATGRRRSAIYWAALRHLNQWWIDAFTMNPRHAAAPAEAAL